MFIDDIDVDSVNRVLASDVVSMARALEVNVVWSDILSLVIV